MKVKKLIIYGFKSFSELTEVSLSDNITLFVGPNGCGKTNIFEALRFVMGENKLWKLRVKELREIIFSGTKEKRASPYAEVSLLVERKDEEKKFTRRAFRDNSQEFYIDNERVSERNYKEELEKIFGKKSYSHFQWEEVEELIRKPKERIKEMIFEACELYDFDYKKRIMEKRLEKSEKELKAFEIVIKDKEKRLEILEEERKRAQKYRNLQEILKEKRELLLKAEYSKLVRDKNRKEKELKESEIFFKTLEEEIVILKKELENIKSEKEELEKELFRLREQKLPIINKKEEILSELNRKYGELSTLKERANYLKDLIKERKKEREKLKEALAEEPGIEEEEISGLEAIEKRYSEIEKKEKEVEKETLLFNLKVEELSKKAEEDLQRKERISKEIEKLVKEKNTKTKEMEELKTKRAEFENKMIEIEGRYTEYERKEKEFFSLKAKIEREINKLEGELIKLKSAREIDDNILKELPFLSSYIDYGKEGIYIYILDDILEAKILKGNHINNELHQFLEKGGKIILEREKYEGEPPRVFKNIQGIGDLLKNRFSNLKIFKDFDEGFNAWKEKVCDYVITEDGYVITKEGILRKILIEKVEKNKRISEIEQILPEKKIKLKEIQKEIEKVEMGIQNIRKERNEIRNKAMDLNIKINQLDSEINFLLSSIERLKREIERIEESLKESKKEKEEFSKKIKEKQRELLELRKIKENLYSELEELRRKKEKLKELRNIRDKIEIYENSLKEREKELNDVINKVSVLEREIENLENERREIEKRLAEFIQRESSIEEKMIYIERKLEEKRDLYFAKEKNFERLSERIIKLRQDIDEIKKNINLYPDNIEFISEQVSVKKLKEEINYIEKKIYSMHDVNLLADEEYKTLEKDYYEKINAFKDLKESIEKLRESIRIMEEKAKRDYIEFLENFREELKNVSNVLLGGDVKIKIEDEKNILESDLSIDVSPSGKKVRSILLLSGGERSLFALSVLFTLANLSPSPLFALDEVDAALDDANTLRFRDYLERIGENSQILLITHNKRTMEIAGRLYGITMEKGVSRIYGIELERV